jgi:hypothetical protein
MQHESGVLTEHDREAVPVHGDLLGQRLEEVVLRIRTDGRDRVGPGAVAGAHVEDDARCPSEVAEAHERRAISGAVWCVARGHREGSQTADDPPSIPACQRRPRWPIGLCRSKDPIRSDLLEADRLTGGGFRPGTWD